MPWNGQGPVSREGRSSVMKRLGAALCGLVAGVDILLWAYILATPAPEKEMVTYIDPISHAPIAQDVVESFIILWISCAMLSFSFSAFGISRFSH